MVRSILEAITDHFDWFFHARVDNEVVPSLYQELWLAFWAYMSLFGHFKVSSWFLKIRNTNSKILGLKIAVFYMKYEHQINWANVYNNNVVADAVRSVRYRLIILLYTLSLNLSRNGWQIWRCTFYVRKT